MNCSMPGLPVHHQLSEFTQTHVRWVSDAIQPSHPLSSPSLPAPNPSQHHSLFQWVSSSHQVARVLEFQLQHQSFQWTPRTDHNSTPGHMFRKDENFNLKRYMYPHIHERERGEWESWLKAQHSENKDHGIQSHHFMANRWRNSGNSGRLYFFGLPHHCRWWLQPWNQKTAYSLEEEFWPT